MKPLISVIIPAYNAAETLAEAVNSCLEQTIINIEVLIIDDGSSDATPEVASALQKADTRVKVFEHPGHINRGVAESRNLGLDRALGDYIGFLDADDAWLPEKLEKQLVVFETHPEVGFVFSDTFLCRDPDPKQPMREQSLGQDLFRTKMAASFNRHPFAAAEILNCFDEPFRYIASPTPLVKNQLFGSGLKFVGPPRLNLQYEDFLMWRILAMRTAFYCIQEPLAVYRMHGKSFTGAFHSKKGTFEHLIGLEEVHREFMKICNEQVKALGWGECIEDKFRAVILEAYPRISRENSPEFKNLVRRWKIGGQVMKMAIKYKLLRLKYFGYDFGRKLKSYAGIK